MIKATIKASFAAIAAMVFSTSTAQAGFTTVKAPPVGEYGHQQILGAHYGINFHQVGDDYYSADGSVVARRIDDFLTTSGVMSVGSGIVGTATDKHWSGANLKLTAVAKFSANSQNLGLRDSNGLFHSLFDVTGFGMSISSLSRTFSSSLVGMGDEFCFIRQGDSGMQCSIDEENSDGRDHMVSYAIEGLAGVDGPVWMTFWEDLNRTPTLSMRRSWADYNDLAIELRAVNAIPLPPGAWAGLITLCGASLPRFRRLFKV